MRKIFVIIAGLVIFSLALFGLPLSVIAANVTFSAETTLSLPNGISLVVLNGGTDDGLVVNDNSTVTVTVGADTDITIRSNSVQTITASVGTIVCSAGNYNQIRITSSDPNSSHNIGFSTATACSPDQGGGGGGGCGGGGTPPAVPTGTSVKINSNDAQTESANITLTLAATNASTMLVSNYSNFSGAGSWESYTTSKSWTLLSGTGTKTVYAKFRSSAGGESAVVSDTIELVAPAQATSGEVTSGAGGTVSLSNGELSVAVPAGAVSGSGTLSIAPSGSYTAPGANQQVIGGQVYGLTMTVGSSAVTSFSEFITLTFTYNNSDVSGINESTIGVYKWNAASSSWLNLGGSVDAANNKVTINVASFSQFALIGEKKAGSGELVSLVCAANADVNDPCKAVYYLGNDGKRYVFPNEKTYKTWYSDFSTVKDIGSTELASYQIGANVTYRPGVKLVKITTDPKVYAVDKKGILRWVKTAAIAEEIYGASWTTMVEDVPDPFFINYTVGSDIAAASDFDKEAAKTGSPDINIDKGL